MKVAMPTPHHLFCSSHWEDDLLDHVECAIKNLARQEYALMRAEYLFQNLRLANQTQKICLTLASLPQSPVVGKRCVLD